MARGLAGVHERLRRALTNQRGVVAADHRRQGLARRAKPPAAPDPRVDGFDDHRVRSVVALGAHRRRTPDAPDAPQNARGAAASGPPDLGRVPRRCRPERGSYTTRSSVRLGAVMRGPAFKLRRTGKTTIGTPACCNRR